MRRINAFVKKNFDVYKPKEVFDTWRWRMVSEKERIVNLKKIGLLYGMEVYESYPQIAGKTA